MKFKRRNCGDIYIGFKLNNIIPYHVSVHKSGHVHVKSNDDKIHIDRPKSIADVIKRSNFENHLENKLTGTIGECPKDYDVLTLDVALNPNILNSDVYYSFLKDVGKLMGLGKNIDGTCPYDLGLICMWASFCIDGLNPELIKEMIFKESNYDFLDYKLGFILLDCYPYIVSNNI